MKIKEIISCIWDLICEFGEPIAGIVTAIIIGLIFWWFCHLMHVHLSKLEAEREVTRQWIATLRLDQQWNPGTNAVELIEMNRLHSIYKLSGAYPKTFVTVESNKISEISVNH